MSGPPLVGSFTYSGAVHWTGGQDSVLFVNMWTSRLSKLVHVM